MATKRTRSNNKTRSGFLFIKKPKPKRKQSSKKRAPASRPPMLQESLVTRIWGSLILSLALLLFFSAIVTPLAGTILVGLIILATAFPPMRSVVDLWLTGKQRGKVAQQAAALRMAVGAGILLFTLMGVITRS